MTRQVSPRDDEDARTVPVKPYKTAPKGIIRSLKSLKSNDAFYMAVSALHSPTFFVPLLFPPWFLIRY